MTVLRCLSFGFCFVFEVHCCPAFGATNILGNSFRREDGKPYLSTFPKLKKLSVNLILGSQHSHLDWSIILTALEFFISATAEANSPKCSSGQYTKGCTRSPDRRPALTHKPSHSSSFVNKAPWYRPIRINCAMVPAYNKFSWNENSFTAILKI